MTPIKELEKSVPDIVREAEEILIQAQSRPFRLGAGCFIYEGKIPFNPQASQPSSLKHIGKSQGFHFIKTVVDGEVTYETKKIESWEKPSWAV